MVGDDGEKALSLRQAWHAYQHHPEGTVLPLLGAWEHASLEDKEEITAEAASKKRLISSLITDAIITCPDDDTTLSQPLRAQVSPYH